MASKIDQLISALAGALRDFDAGNGSMPREELADALALADAADEEHLAQVRALRANVEAAKGQAHNDAEHRGWLRGNDWNARERDNAIRLRDEMRGERDEARADAERVRRGARCLRERCKRLEARVRMTEERRADAEVNVRMHTVMARRAAAQLRSVGVAVTIASLMDDAIAELKAQGGL